MFLVVGLGNPGSNYEKTRHNVGFKAVDEIASCYAFETFKSSKFKAELTSGTIQKYKAYLLKPLTYMNLSGEAVGQAMRFYKLSPENVIVIHDDLDLALGKIRVKKGGGHGGHNGLRSLDAHISPNYTRIRIGIDRPREKTHVEHYVLQPFKKDETDTIQHTIDDIASALPHLLGDGPERFMNYFHQLHDGS